MDELEKIIVAIDLSDNVYPVIDRGFLLADASGAQLIALHAVGMDALAPLREFLGEDADRVSQEILAEAHDRLEEFIAGSPMKDRAVVNLQVDRGIAGAVIPEFAEQAGADLVVIGAHGSGFIQRMLVGSTASRLLRKSTCPVLVVKQEAHRPYRRALVAIDFSPGSETAIRFARRVAPGANLVLLHIVDVPFEGKMQYAGVSDEIIQRYRAEASVRATRQLQELARSAGLAEHDYSGIVVHGDATRQIIQHEERFRCDLVVMGKHGTHVTEEFLLGSVTKRVLAESRGDMLVVVDKRSPEPQPLAP